MELQNKKEFTKEDKRRALNFAIGMMQVDGVKPDQEYLDLVEKEINGEITLDEMKWIILKKHDKTGRYQCRRHMLIRILTGKREYLKTTWE